MSYLGRSWIWRHEECLRVVRAFQPEVEVDDLWLDFLAPSGSKHDGRAFRPAREVEQTSP